MKGAATNRRSMNMQANNTPEWIDAREAKRMFSLGKTTLYHLAAVGKIKTASLREPGTQRGKRLFSCASIRLMLEELADGIS